MLSLAKIHPLYNVFFLKASTPANCFLSVLGNVAFKGIEQSKASVILSKDVWSRWLRECVARKDDKASSCSNLRADG